MIQYTIGIDFGTDSARAVLVDTADGRVISESVHNYPRWATFAYCDNALQQYRQHPLDYVESLKAVLHGVLDANPGAAACVKGIGIDFTGATPCLMDKELRPLSLYPEWKDNPDAMFVLWKDHSGAAEASLIEKTVPARFLENSGGAYSPECYWGKLLHVLHNSPDLYGKAYCFVEACDWICALLTGLKDADSNRRSTASATAKMMYNNELESFPPLDWFESMDSGWMDIVRRTVAMKNWCCDEVYGTVGAEYSSEFGFASDTVVGCAAIDAFAGCIGGNIRDGRPILTLGTSSGYMITAPKEQFQLVRGTFSQGLDFIVPGKFCVEMGQSAFGDVYAFLAKLLNFVPAAKGEKTSVGEVLGMLAAEAEKLPLREDSPFATDYFNGRRSPDPNPSLWGSLMGLRLNTSAPELYAALVEATCFGVRAIIERMTEHGLAPKEIMCIGGISQKSPYTMQMLSDVCSVPMMVCGAKEAAALGSSIAAAVAAGLYPSIESAQDKMCGGVLKTYLPDPSRKEIYDKRYAKYKAAAQFAEKSC